MNKNNGLKIYKNYRMQRMKIQGGVKKKFMKIAQTLPFGIKEIHVKTRQSFPNSILEKRIHFILKILK